MAKVYDSGALSNLSYGNPLTVDHDLGYIPAVYAVHSVVSGVDGGFAPVDPDDPAGSPGVYVDSFTETQAVIKMLDGYSFTDQIRLVCYHGA